MNLFQAALELAALAHKRIDCLNGEQLATSGQDTLGIGLIDKIEGEHLAEAADFLIEQIEREVISESDDCQL